MNVCIGRHIGRHIGIHIGRQFGGHIGGHFHAVFVLAGGVRQELNVVCTKEKC